MKLAAFSHAGEHSLGAVRGAGIVDLSPDFATMKQFIAAGEDGLNRAIRRADLGTPIPLTDVTLRAPIRSPKKFFAIAANYQSHIDEVQRTTPGYVPPVFQRWFSKMPSCINDPYAPILMPPEGTDLDYEVELAIIVGKRCRRVRAEHAAGVVAGYTICNDVSVRDWQKRSPTIMLGKSFDTHGPLGPWMVTPDEIGNPHDLRVTCTVNGEVRQSGNTSEMINDCWAQIAYLSTVCTLEPGDVIATGTPSGTGGSMRPQGLLKPGRRRALRNRAHRRHRGHGCRGTGRVIEGADIDPADKAEILDLIYRRARGADRFDVALMHSCHPADATDNHGTFTGSMHAMIDGLEAAMRDGPPCLSKNHVIANALFTRRGDDVFVESYHVAHETFAHPCGVEDTHIGGPLPRPVPPR